MTEQKKIPKAIVVMIALLAFSWGSIIGGLLIVLGFACSNQLLGFIVIWAMITFTALIVFQILAWKYRGLLLEWGLITPKKKKEEKKQ